MRVEIGVILIITHFFHYKLEFILYNLFSCGDEYNFLGDSYKIIRDKYILPGYRYISPVDRLKSKDNECFLSGYSFIISSDSFFFR